MKFEAKVHGIAHMIASHFVPIDLSIATVSVIIVATTPATPLNDAHPGGFLFGGLSP